MTNLINVCFQQDLFSRPIGFPLEHLESGKESLFLDLKKQQDPAATIRTGESSSYHCYYCLQQLSSKYNHKHYNYKYTLKRVTMTTVTITICNYIK